MAAKLACLYFGLLLVVALAGCGSSGHNSTTLANDPPLQITTQSPLPSARINVPYSTTFTASGGTPPYSWSASNLPTGLVMSTVGTLSGTPTGLGGGQVDITVAVSDTVRQTVTGTFSLAIAAPLQITTTSLPSSSPGVFYNATLGASGGFPPYTWSITQGSLPSGLTLNATTGLISGTPMNTGTSNFTVQVSDTGPPPSSTTANLSITINPPPAREAALYNDAQIGYQIPSDGSLVLLPSSPEMAINGSGFGVSPILPLLFMTTCIGGGNCTEVLESALVNPDYSLALYSSAGLPGINNYGSYAPATVDPGGSDVYLPGYIDNGQTTGILIYKADGSFGQVGSIAIPDVNSYNSRLVFSPDGRFAFLPTLQIPSGTGAIVSLSRASDGTLTVLSTYTLPTAREAIALSASHDGRYLAASEPDNNSPGLVQVFSIGADGTLTPATQPFTVLYDPQGDPDNVADETWDSSGSYLLLATAIGDDPFGDQRGGVAVLSFSGSSLSETVYPVGAAVRIIRRDGSFVYAQETCRRNLCPYLDGYDFQNGQLTALPGSPWTYRANGAANDMVIY